MRSISGQYLNKMMDDVDRWFAKMPKVDKSLPFSKPTNLDAMFIDYYTENLTEINNFYESDYQEWLEKYSVKIKEHSLWVHSLPDWVVDPNKSVNWNWTGFKLNERSEYQKKLDEWQKVQDKGYNNMGNINKWIDGVAMLFLKAVLHSGVKSPENIALMSKTQDMDMGMYLYRSMVLPEYNDISKSVVKRSLRSFIYEINKEVKKHE